jgi:hypothetical protein
VNDDPLRPINNFTTGAVHDIVAFALLVAIAAAASSIAGHIWPMLKDLFFP